MTFHQNVELRFPPRGDGPQASALVLATLCPDTWAKVASMSHLWNALQIRNHTFFVWLRTELRILHIVLFGIINQN